LAADAGTHQQATTGNVLLPRLNRASVRIDIGAAVHPLEDFLSGKLFDAGVRLRQCRTSSDGAARWRQTLLKGRCILVLDRKIALRVLGPFGTGLCRLERSRIAILRIDVKINGVAEVDTRTHIILIRCLSLATNNTRVHVRDGLGDVLDLAADAGRDGLGTAKLTFLLSKSNKCPWRALMVTQTLTID